jgi:hypothetical protein
VARTAQGPITAYVARTGFQLLCALEHALRQPETVETRLFLQANTVRAAHLMGTAVTSRALDVMTLSQFAVLTGARRPRVAAAVGLRALLRDADRVVLADRRDSILLHLLKGTRKTWIDDGSATLSWWSGPGAAEVREGEDLFSMYSGLATPATLTHHAFQRLRARIEPGEPRGGATVLGMHDATLGRLCRTGYRRTVRAAVEHFSATRYVPHPAEDPSLVQDVLDFHGAVVQDPVQAAELAARSGALGPAVVTMPSTLSHTLPVFTQDTKVRSFSCTLDLLAKTACGSCPACAGPPLANLIRLEDYTQRTYPDTLWPG